MKLADVAAKLQSGDLIALRGTSLSDRIIRFWTGETWNHVGVVWVAATGPMVFQARYSSGVTCVPLASLLPLDWVAVGHPLSDAALATARAALGQSYSLLDMILAGLNMHPRMNGRICSEYAARILAANNDIDAAEAFGAVTPGALVEWLLDRGASLESIEP